MKKVLFLAALLLVCFSGVTNAQTRKQREDAKREAWKKERQEKKALEAQQDSVSYVQAINALKNGSFVLEADNVVFRNGIMRFVSSNTNYVEVNDGQGIIFRPPLLILCITGARTAWEVSRFREM